MILSYKMHCDCTLTEDQLVVVTTKAGKIRTRLCPTHKKSVAYRIGVCASCGNTFKLNKSSLASKYCPGECRKKHTAEIRVYKKN